MKKEIYNTPKLMILQLRRESVITTSADNDVTFDNIGNITSDNDVPSELQ